MVDSVQDVWDRFERWSERYQEVCANEIRRVCKRGFSNGSAQFLLTHHELGCDPILDLDLDEDELNARIQRKLLFLSAYLADISHDGGRFMSMHSKFLHLQSPKRCLGAMGVWLEQSMDVDKIEAGNSFVFQGFDGSLFIKSIADVDWASMRAILPFDWMHLRKPGGSEWTQEERKELKQHFREDLGFDGYEYKLKTRQKRGLLTLSFEWL